MIGPDSCLHCVTGRSWENKISDIRQTMAGKNVDMLVVTGLDETACKLNLLKRT